MAPLPPSPSLGLQIRFDDGITFTYPAELLRAESPAANRRGPFAPPLASREALPLLRTVIISLSSPHPRLPLLIPDHLPRLSRLSLPPFFFRHTSTTPAAWRPPLPRPGRPPTSPPPPGGGCGSASPSVPRPPPPMPSGRRHVAVLSAHLVGRYGLRLCFDDLHDTAIYPWGLLYAIGAEKRQRIRRYLEALKAAGLSRDPRGGKRRSAARTRSRSHEPAAGPAG